MTTVIWRATGRQIVCDDEQARRWIAEGAALPVTVVDKETTSRTTVPVPARLPDVETR
jgi:hypothetical protein